jgi:site-specific recombinase XerD
VRHLTAGVETAGRAGGSRQVSPHTWRHTAAVHLLEAGVDVNVIRGWLGHVSLNTTNRYAEITLRMKTEAMKLCAPDGSDARKSQKAAWQDDGSLLHWLTTL